MPNLSPHDVALGITYYVVLLFSLSVHESAHGWMAFRMGDPTAMNLGRVSLNPIVHIDPIGTLLIPMLQIFGGIGIPLAWAKPTPVQARNFHPGMLARGQVLVAAAGPVSNLALAVLFTLALLIVSKAGMPLRGDNPIVVLLWMGLTLNVGLAVFNLVPLPPLDGSWIVSWGLPRSVAQQYDRFVEPYGQWILLILIMTRVLIIVIGPVVGFITRLLLSVLG